MFSVINIKTTTSNAKIAKLMYLKIVQYDHDMKVLTIFESFIHPEIEVTPYISQVSGITQNQLNDAPKFFQIAKKFIELTKDQVLIANRMSFVYQVIKNAFKELGFSYSEKSIDALLLMKYLGLQSTVKKSVFERMTYLCKNYTNDLIQIASDKNIFEQIQKPLSQEIISNLPTQIGVYYFHNQKNKLIYVGKSVNIKKRVQSHLSNQQSKKAMDMKAHIHKVNYKLTGSELIALLLESNDIKKYKPRFNRAQKRNKFQYGLFQFYDNKGYLNFIIEQNPNNIPITTFSSLKDAQSFFLEKMKKYNLCQCLSNLYKNTSHTCFLHQINECQGAKLEKETVEEYNQRAIQTINEIQYPHKEFLIIDKGRTEIEKSVIYIKNYQYQGWGYIGKEEQSIQKLIDCVQTYLNNKDVELIVQSYLKANQLDLIICK